jgi:hypothetical protein
MPRPSPQPRPSLEYPLALATPTALAPPPALNAWHPALRKQRTEERELEASLGHLGRPCLKK